MLVIIRGVKYPPEITCLLVKAMGPPGASQGLQDFKPQTKRKRFVIRVESSIWLQANSLLLEMSKL